VLKFSKGFIPSKARPSLRFLGSCPNSGYNRLIFSHYGESTRCHRKPSIILPYACHRRYFASSALANNLLNLGIIGRYQQTFAGRFFLCFHHHCIGHCSVCIVIPHMLGNCEFPQTDFCTKYSH